MPHSSLLLPGTVLSESSIIEDYIYSVDGQNQIIVLNLSLVPVTQFGNYGLIINGSLVTFIYTGNSGLADFTAKLSNFLNQYGFFWATVTGLSEITLTAREKGTQYTVTKGINMTQATVTQTQSGVIPMPLVPGTLMFFDIRQDSTKKDNDHRYVTTHNIVAGVSGFNQERHCAGILVAVDENDGYASLINGSKVRLMRRGIISYTNYGTTMNRLNSVTFNKTASTALLPCGGLGGSLNEALSTAMSSRLLADSFTLNGEIGRVRIDLP